MRLTLRPLATALLILCLAAALAAVWPGVWDHLLQNAAFWPARFVAVVAAPPDTISALATLATPFAASFVHGSIFDLLIPGLLLLLVGSMVEDLLGWLGLLALFIAGILASAIMIVIVAGGVMQPFFGCFNAVSAIVGAYLILRPNQAMPGWSRLPPRNARRLQLLLLWLLINLVVHINGPLGGLLVNVMPSMASFAAGLLLAHPLLLWKYRKA